MGTTLTPRILDAIKDAMRAHDSTRLNTLRFLHAAIKQKEVDQRTTLDDAAVTAIIDKQVKQRRESIAAFESAGRTETAAQEKAELEILQEFLPQAATAEEIDAAVEAAIQQARDLGLQGGAAMGKVMGILKPALAGQADLAAISAQVKTRLA